MSGTRDVQIFWRAQRILADEAHERVWLMRQLGASFERIAVAVGRSTFTVRKQYRRRLEAAQNYDSLEGRALRAMQEAL
jgi:hypothetical protein